MSVSRTAFSNEERPYSLLSRCLPGTLIECCGDSGPRETEKKYTYYITIYDIHDIDINPTKNPEYPMARDVFISSQLSPCIWHCNGAGTDAHLFGVGNFNRQFIGNLARLGHLWINWFGSNNLPPMGSKKHQAPVHFSTMPVPVRVRKTNSRKELRQR